MKRTTRASFAATYIAGVAMMGGMPVMAQGSTRAQQTAYLSDYKTYCANMQRGGGRIKRCLNENAAKLSPTCRAALAEHETNRQAQKTK